MEPGARGRSWHLREAAVPLAASLSLYGCSELGPVCGATTPAGACVSVVSIVGLEAGTETDDVDVAFDTCSQGSGSFVQSISEPFTDHDAVVTVENQPYPQGPPAGAPVTLQHFKIDYKVNECPTGAVCPGLTGWTFDGLTVTVYARQTTQFAIPMVPIRKKQEYLNNGGSSGPWPSGGFPSYSATVTMTGNNEAGDQINLVGAAEFSFGSFNNCPAGWRENGG